MLSWISLAVCSLVIMVIVTFGITKCSRSLLRRFPEIDPTGFVAGFILVLVSLIPAIYFAKQTNTFLALGILFFAVWSLLLLQLKADSKIKEMYRLLICLIAAFFIPPNSAFIQGFTYGYPILGIALYLMMRLFILFDRIPFYSLLTVITQAFLGCFLVRRGILPEVILMPAFYMIVVIVSTAQTTNALIGRTILGPFAASVVGFELGFIWLCVMGQGNFFVPLVLYSYDLFELLIAGIMTIWTTRHLYPIARSFLLEKAMETQIKPKKLRSFMFMILLLLALSSFLTLGDGIDYKSLSLVLFLLLISAFFTLRRWGIAQPTWKELGSDIKHSFLDIKEEITSLPLKKDLLKRKK